MFLQHTHWFTLYVGVLDGISSRTRNSWAHQTPEAAPECQWPPLAPCCILHPEIKFYAPFSSFPNNTKSKLTNDSVNDGVDPIFFFLHNTITEVLHLQLAISSTSPLVNQKKVNKGSLKNEVIPQQHNVVGMLSYLSSGTKWHPLGYAFRPLIRESL